VKQKKETHTQSVKEKKKCSYLRQFDSVWSLPSIPSIISFLHFPPSALLSLLTLTDSISFLQLPCHGYRWLLGFTFFPLLIWGGNPIFLLSFLCFYNPYWQYYICWYKAMCEPPPNVLSFGDNWSLILCLLKMCLRDLYFDCQDYDWVLKFSFVI